MPDKNPITKAWMLEAISDREWHPQYELINRASRYVKPEVASRRYYENARCKDPTETPLDKAIYYGLNDMVRRVLCHLHRLGLIEYRGHSEEREIRFIGWYCWNCGRIQSSDKTANGTCNKCPIYCWSCGDTIAEPKYEEDELCEKCRKIHDAIINRNSEIKIPDPEDETRPRTKAKPRARPKKPKYKPVVLRFPVIEDVEEPESEPKHEPAVYIESNIEETGIYHSPLKPRKPKRKKKETAIEQAEELRKSKRKKKESKTKQTVEPQQKEDANAEVCIELFSFKSEPLLLTYNPIVDLNHLPALMGAIIKR